MLESERILLHADFKITMIDRYIEKNHVTRNMRGLETVYVAKKKDSHTQNPPLVEQHDSWLLYYTEAGIGVTG